MGCRGQGISSCSPNRGVHEGHRQFPSGMCEARKFGNDVDAAKWIPNEQRKNDYIQLVKDWAAYHGLSLPSTQARRKRKHGCFNEQAWEALSADEQAP